jgi:hypothetical protein
MAHPSDDIVRGSDIGLGIEPLTAQLSLKAKRDIVWDAVYNARSMLTDPDDARKLADNVVALIDRGQLYNEAEEAKRREVKEAEKKIARQRRNSRIKRKVLIFAPIFLVIFAVANIPYWVIRSHANDYASVDPASVVPQAVSAISSYYGQNDMPARLNFQSKRHDIWNGQPAWYALFRTDKNKKVCAYVWSGANGDYSKTLSGKDCPSA